MIEDFGKVLTNIGLAGVGLAAIAVEQAGKAGKILVEKGAVAVEEGRKYGAELQEKYQQDTQRRREEQFNQRISQMDANQREALRRRLAELDELEQEAAKAAEELNQDDDNQAF
ncbi:hypothetical protein [Intestinimonas massiliensis (ex Afouda et al. 2020)]|uniref:hypothetical protein n=1 Tax=Intestinimonas massiliensis (ex Afouda et al. 2020) TaxID=1673721 RepID=UPI00103084DB|nr:hypothetical protein [Intestinimonas massiliensis (ex Afouda et al. 2020)]